MLSRFRGSVDRSSVHPACLFSPWRRRKASLYLGTAPFFSLPLKKDPSHSGQFAGLQLLIRVIDSNFFYQRRGLMFDVFSIQFSRYGQRIAGMRFTAFCTPSALRKPFLDAHRMQSDGSMMKKLTRCSALAGSHRAFSKKNVWQPPALPCRLQHSTIGRTDLHRRVRDGNGCCLRTHRHQTNLSM